jgi:hypothetical protein
VADRRDETGRDQNQGVHGPRGVQALGKGELAAPEEAHRRQPAVVLVRLGEERLEIAQELGGAAGVAGDEAAILTVEPRAAPVEREEWCLTFPRAGNGPAPSAWRRPGPVFASGSDACPGYGPAEPSRHCSTLPDSDSAAVPAMAYGTHTSSRPP